MEKKKRGSATSVKEVVLGNLGLSSLDDINNWFRKSYADEYRVDFLNEAAVMILDGKWDGIYVCGDYDVDGITATAQLKIVLSALNLPVNCRIPRRFSEGFGLSPSIIQEIPDGKNLIVTVDNGIAALEAVSLAKERGFSVIVTDHHLPQVEAGKTILPDADIIIDPNAIPGSADFNGYCGSGLALKLMKALLKEMTKRNPEGKGYKSLVAAIEPLAMLGTICDVMELREENYVFVRNGLAKLNRGIAPIGLLALAERMWLKDITSEDVAFMIGPALNANGRLSDDGAVKSMTLLSTTNKAEAKALAELSVGNNNLRKQQVENAVAFATMTIKAQKLEDTMPMILYIPQVNEGIIGIVAGRLSESFGNITMVFTDAEGGLLKGSGRAAEGLNIKKVLDEMPELFAAYGGHEGAAGMTIDKDEFAEFKVRSRQVVEGFGWTPVKSSDIQYDLEVENKDVPAVLEELVKYAPFGHGNPVPVFKVKNFEIAPGPDMHMYTEVGKQGIKLYSAFAQAVGFSMRQEVKDRGDVVLDLFGTLSYNRFKGQSTPQISFLEFDARNAVI